MSLVVVVGAVGYLIYDGITADDAAPAFSLELEPPLQRAEQFVVPVTITNTGGGTAQAVQVEVRLDRPDGGDERGSFEIALLPRGATREGSVLFRSDPRAGDLKARVLGYERP